MARVGKLTVLKVVAIARAKAPGYYSDGGGLFLQISRYGTASWVFRYRIDNRLREMGLGSLDTIGLADARERARKAREQRLDGLDPIEQRKRSRLSGQLDRAKAMSFKECGRGYIGAHKTGWKSPVHARQWSTTLETSVYPMFGDLSVQAIDTGLVMKAIEPIWTTTPETASRVRGRIESILDWARARGYRQGDNPARWRGHLDNLLPELTKAKRAKRQATGRGEHHPAMPFAEVPVLIPELAAREAIAARALEFMIFTAKRTEEVIGARWPEIDRTARMWTIPAGRMKGEREHRVPLSEAAIAVLDTMRPGGEAEPQGYIFPGAKEGRGLSNMAMLNLLQKRMGYLQFTVHGFRSSFRDWAAERTGFPAEVAEMALAHVVSDKVEAAYRRGDLFEKRRQLAEAWAKFCTAPPPSGKVVPMRAKTHGAN